MSESSDFEKVAEPYRYNFEIAWEVANKGAVRSSLLVLCLFASLFLCRTNYQAWCGMSHRN